MSPAEIIPYTPIFLLFIGLVLIVIGIIYPNEKYFSKGGIMNFVVALIFLVLISVIVFVFIFIMHYRVKELYSIDTGYDAADLTSSIVMAISTIIYVVFTAFIFYTTNENTKQSIKNAEQNAKAQKIAYLERRLELFYLPMENALKKLNLDDIKKLNHKVDTNENKDYALYLLIQKWWSFREDYYKITPFTYLTSDNVKTSIHTLTTIFFSNNLFSEKFTDGYLNLSRGENYPAAKIKEYITEGLDKKYLSEAKHISNNYIAVLDKIEEDIKSISEELEKLVNP